MGAGKSRQVPFSYEEACRRIDPPVLARIEETFRRSFAITGYLPQSTFSRDILGDSVPSKLAEELYRGFGGTQKGLSLKDLVCGLALLAHGSVDEKAKFLALLLSVDGYSVEREAVDKMVAACDAGGYTPVDLDTLFTREPLCTVREFEEWVKRHPNLSSFTKWLLVPGESGFSLVGEPDPPSFYQTLGQLHGVSEKEVMDLERTYWSLKSGITTGGGSRFDLETFVFYASPPVPEPLCRGLFEAFDENCDGQLDLAEMVRAVGWSCRGSPREKHNLCFKIFDEDGDGALSWEELTGAITHLQTIVRENSEETPEDIEDIDSMVNSAMEKFALTKEGCLNEEEYFKWAESTTPISLSLLHLMYQVCHVRFGLRPRTKADETMVIGGYMLRFHKAGLRPGDTVYIVDGEWFKQWRKVTGYEGDPCSNDAVSSGKKKKKKKDKHRHKKHRAPSPQVVLEAGKAHASTQTPPTGTGGAGMGGEAGLVERGEDVVELLTVAEGGGGRQMTPNSSFSSLNGGDSPSQASSGVVAGGEGAGPVENRIPLIDNSGLLVHDSTNKKVTSLTNEGGFLKKELVEGETFFFLPVVVWKVFTSWYGTAGLQGGPALPRLVRQDGSIDFHPVQFKVYRHTTLPPAGKQSSLPWPLPSFFGTLGIISSKPATPPIVSSAGVGPGGADGGPIQPPLPRRVLYYYAAFTGATTVAEMSEYIEKVLHVKSEDLRLYDLTDEENPVHLDNETRTVEDLVFTDGQKLLIETRNKDNSWPEEIIAVMKEVRAKDKENKDKHEDSKSSDVQVPHGATGLSNLGNTCFMNSALQCVSNVQPLTRYFRERDYLVEINKDSPLGMGGVMAKRYGELVQDLWNGHSKSITPLKFRFTVGRCAPRFNGFQQQDAQELLAFVLDGLHEDLNRVKEKPYKELKDSDGRPDDEVSREAWDYHLSRNQSVIVDLFQGQLKSVVRCKVCNYKSVRFDPFTFLSLPLPMESTINIETVVVRLDGSQPVRYGLKLEVDDKYRALLVTLSRLTGIKKSNLLLVEIFGATIRNFPPDSTKIRSQLGGWLYAFEIPDPPPPPSFRTTISVPLPSLQPHSLACTSSSSSPHEERERGRVEEGGRGERGEIGDSGEERGAEVAGNPRSQHGREEDEEGGGEEGREEAGGWKENGEGGLEAGREREEGDTGPPGRQLPSNSSIDGSDDTECGVGLEGIRPSIDRPLGSRDPTPPILLAPEDDDRLPAAVVVADDVEVGVEPESHDPGVASHDTGRGVDSSATSPLHSGDIHDGFIFAVHRKKFLMEQYFVASQKSRPVLFGTPLVVPCTPPTPCRQVYELVWQSVRRLVIPDIPSSESKERRGYPFKLSLVGKDGLSCAVCPWRMFCRGCPIECNDAAIDDSSPYIAIDWDVNILHLKYQSAQERPVEHESMESLKTMDLDPIDLYQCFKAFVREDDLGDEECWYCKQCKTHQEAVKSLEIWRLPPILIIHLKRFQFFNGRWVKSQRIVRFPTSNLDPLRFTAQNGNQKRAENGTETTSTESREDQERPENGIETAASSKEDSRKENPLLSDTRPDIANTGTMTTQPLANGGRGHPAISEDPQPVAPVMEARSQQDQLDKSLYNREGNVYNLVAITCHTGVLGGGHYTSFCKNPNGNWYYYNDSSCKETSEERVLEESPYLLFYEMKDLDHYYNLFRAQKEGKRQDIGSTEDDKAYEETIKHLRQKCCIQ